MVARYLFPTEKFRGEWRQHWMRPLRALLFIATYAVLSSTIVLRSTHWPHLGWTFAAIVTVAVLASALRLLGWYTTRFVLTNKRLLLVRGVFHRQVATVPLARVVDLYFAQWLLGRLLDYGTFRVDSASRLGGLRKVVELPHPNELYLRIIEELYEPEAVEARLSRAVQDVLLGPQLVNYRGWVSVLLQDEHGEVAVSAEREVVLQPARRYEIAVTIARLPVTGLAEPLVVSEGRDADIVQFEVELDSDDPALRHPGVSVVVAEGGIGTALLDLSPASHSDLSWLWIRVSQGRRTLQSIELTAQFGEPPESRPPRPRPVPR